MREMLHSTKSQSILQWYNALTSSVNVQSLAQFADGSLFCSIVESVYTQAQIENPVPKFSLPDSSICEESSEGGDKTLFDKIKDGEGPSTSKQQIEAMETSEDPSEDSVSTEINSEMEVQKKYDLIKKFIDNFFQMDSNDIISYTECMGGKDIELAKVAVLLLSAMVQNFLSSNNESLQTITLLEASVQEDIKECLALLLERNEKDPIAKTELVKVLGRATKHKATPRRKTPQRGHTDETPSKRGRRLSTIVCEDVVDSPLKGLLQSPNNSQHRAAIAIFRKETEISKLRNALHMEEMKNVDLRLEKKQLNDDLLKKKEELEYMKSDFRKYKEMTEEREADYSVQRAKNSEEINKLNSIILEQKEEIKSLQSELTGLVTTITELENKLLQKNTTEESADKIMIETMNVKIQELEAENESKGNMMQEYLEKIKYLEKDVIEYKQMYEEHLNRRNTPKMSPPTRETVGNIHYADENYVLKLEQENRKLCNCKDSLRAQLKEKSENIKAVMDQVSKLQNKQEKIMQIVRSCLNCYTLLASEESDVSQDSTQFGKLWDSTPKNNVPTTRSKSTGSFTTSTPITFLTVEKLQQLLRIFYKLLTQWKVVVESEVWAKLDLCTQNIDTVDDFIKGFEQMIRLLKYIIPPVSETVESTVKEAIREAVEPDSSEQLFEKMKRRFSILTASLKADLASKDNELNSAKEEVQNLQLEKEAVEKEKTEMDTKLQNLQAKYDNVYKAAKKIKHDRDNCVKAYEKLQETVSALGKEPEKCDNCDVLRSRFIKARGELRDSEKEVDDLNNNIKDLQYKIKSLEHHIKDLNQEKAKLEDKIQHNNAFLFGSSSAKTALINKYYQQSLAQTKKRIVPDLDDLDSEDSQPVVNVNTFFLCPERNNKPNWNNQPEKREPCPETSTSSHFANRSIKSAYLQTEDEEDFLNHSSLSQIQGGYIEEAVNPEQRLRELQRRNTLCPPHLQSSYPLEIQHMTPSERKYSMLPSQFPSTSTNTDALKKRKASEIDATDSQVDTKKVMYTSTVSSAYVKPHTPVRFTSALKKNKTFKTPSSIRRLMRMPQRKNKQQ